MREYERMLLVIALGFALVCFVPITGWATTVSEVQAYVDGLAVEEFDEADPDVKLSVQEELIAVSEMLDLVAEETDEVIKAALNQDAIDNLGILQQRTDGCVVSGTPDEDDLLVTCTTQESLHSQLGSLITEIQGN